MVEPALCGCGVLAAARCAVCDQAFCSGHIRDSDWVCHDCATDALRIAEQKQADSTAESAAKVDEAVRRGPESVAAIVALMQAGKVPTKQGRLVAPKAQFASSVGKVFVVAPMITGGRSSTYQLGLAIGIDGRLWVPLESYWTRRFKVGHRSRSGRYAVGRLEPTDRKVYIEKAGLDARAPIEPELFEGEAFAMASDFVDRYRNGLTAQSR